MRIKKERQFYAKLLANFEFVRSVKRYTKIFFHEPSSVLNCGSLKRIADNEVWSVPIPRQSTMLERRAPTTFFDGQECNQAVDDGETPDGRIHFIASGLRRLLSLMNNQKNPLSTTGQKIPPAKLRSTNKQEKETAKVEWPKCPNSFACKEEGQLVEWRGPRKQDDPTDREYTCDCRKADERVSKLCV